MKVIKQILGGDLKRYTMVVALAVLIGIFNIISDGRMLTSSNFQNLLAGNAYVLVLALGMLMVIVIGQIDLSVGSVAGFSGMVMAIAARIKPSLVGGSTAGTHYRTCSRRMARILLS